MAGSSQERLAGFVSSLSATLAVPEDTIIMMLSTPRSSRSAPVALAEVPLHWNEGGEEVPRRRMVSQDDMARADQTFSRLGGFNDGQREEVDEGGNMVVRDFAVPPRSAPDHGSRVNEPLGLPDDWFEPRDPPASSGSRGRRRPRSRAENLARQLGIPGAAPRDPRRRTRRVSDLITQPGGNFLGTNTGTTIPRPLRGDGVLPPPPPPPPPATAGSEEERDGSAR